MVAEFAATLLRQGWTPGKWMGQSGELTLPISQAEHETETCQAKPWWRFW